ncbi:MAG: DUF554 domain-containing protein [Erysipelothrix sp.]|nr:DUF554 domain-containing protein [Erysipelothrix sp.]
MKYILLNGALVIVGALLSTAVKKRVSETIIHSILLIANLSVIVIGIQGAIQTNNPILLLISGVLGGIVGTALNIEKGFNTIGKHIQNKAKTQDSDFMNGFITLSIITCVGSLAIIGPLNIRLLHDPTILVTKSVLDFLSAIIYGTIYGKSTALAGFSIILYQGLIYVFALVLEPILVPAVILEMSAIGSLLVFALGLKLLKIIDIDVANYLPAIIIPLVYYLLTVLLKIPF